MRSSHVGIVPHVLVVDDNDDIRAFLAEVLADEAGCTVLEAQNGALALALLRDPRSPLPCLILLDWNMPKTNGAAVLAALRQDPELAAIPVVVVTAAGDVNVPGVRVVLKPLGLLAVLDLVREHCDRARASPGPPAGKATAQRS